MKRLTIIASLVGLILCAGCGVKRSQAYYEMPSQVLSANYDGTYVIRTQVRARNAVIAFTDAQRKVVEEVIFDGVAAANEGVEALKPLCFDRNAREKYEDYFHAFFADEGDWKKYASLKDKRDRTTRYQRTLPQMVQTMTVSIDRAGLKHRLQADGIIPAQGRY